MYFFTLAILQDVGWLPSLAIFIYRAICYDRRWTIWNKLYRQWVVEFWSKMSVLIISMVIQYLLILWEKFEILKKISEMNHVRKWRARINYFFSNWKLKPCLIVVSSIRMFNYVFHLCQVWRTLPLRCSQLLFCCWFWRTSTDGASRNRMEPSLWLSTSRSMCYRVYMNWTSSATSIHPNVRRVTNFIACCSCRLNECTF